MIKIMNNLFIGTDEECYFKNSNFSFKELQEKSAVIHACKDPCHKEAVGYEGNLNSSHPNYLILARENDLFLNMVDMQSPLLPQYTDGMIETAMHFIERNIKDKVVFIHCNKGESRAPSIALIYAAKKAKIISNEGYYKAKADFSKILPGFQPGIGIEGYMIGQWRRF